jgi:putative salt-induced outer membrane protein YdiY
MKRLAVAIVMLLLCISTTALAAPFNFIVTPNKAEVAFTIKPFEISVGDNYEGTINVNTGEKSFKHDLSVGGKFYLPAKGQLDTYVFGAAGLDQLTSEKETQDFKVGVGSQYNFDDNFAVFGEFGAKVIRDGEELTLTTAKNSLGLKFGF